MPTASINTADPIALRAFMTETIFGVEGQAITEADKGLIQPVSNPKPVAQFSFYGKNQRHYLFLTREEQHEWMPVAALEAFTKTLAALKLTIDDIAVLNVAKLPEMPTADAICAFFKPKVVVLLGASLVWPEQQDLTVFRTHSFDEMLTDAEKKRIFWTTIKTLLV
jgi:hypothetical protein